MFSPGLAQESYPIRRSSETRSWWWRPSPWNDRNRRLAWRAYCQCFKNPDAVEQRITLRGADFTHPERVAQDFASFAIALRDVSDLKITRHHVESAFALLCNRVEVVPEREDRLLVCSLAATAMARCAVPVHFLADTLEDITSVWQFLHGIFQRLEIDVACVSAGDSEQIRRNAYRADIVFTTTRECAMDFVRDATNWSGRTDFSRQKVERLLGRRGNHTRLLLRGLHCAIHLDIDSALIDNARTPIVITKDAHPMHETAEIKRSAELAAQMIKGEHFELTGDGDEVQFTAEGEELFVTWGNQLGGIWSASHIGQTIMKVTLLVQYLLEEGKHFAIDRKDIQWLIPVELIPGQRVYGEDFIRQVILITFEVDADPQQEIVARASYQQIFSRYIHNCGCCHSIANHKAEFQSIYGLPVFSRWPGRPRLGVQRTHLVSDRDALFKFCESWLEKGVGEGASLIICSEGASVSELADHFQEASRPCVVLDESQSEGSVNQIVSNEETMTSGLLLSRIPTSDWQQSRLPLRVLLVERSVSRTRDARILNAIGVLRRKGHSPLHVTQVLSADGSLLKGETLGFTKATYRLFGLKLGGWIFDRQVSAIQRKKGNDLAKVRRDLLAYDSGMQGLLSFSGRGIYD